MSLSIITQTVMTLRLVSYSVMPRSMTALRTLGYIRTLTITYFIVILTVVMLIVKMMGVIMLSVLY